MIAESELILSSTGKIYHLDLAPGALAEKIMLVGDPDRVDKLAQYLESVEFVHQKRELRTCTGRYKGERVSIISTGMGIGGIEIVLTEVDALFNIDLNLRQVKEHKHQLTFLRVGTCGGLAEEANPGDLIFSEAAIGLDNLLDFYQRECSIFEAGLEQSFKDFLASHTTLPPHAYVAEADQKLVTESQNQGQFLHGLTLTAVGFYGPQGRNLGRALPLDEGFLDKLSDFVYQDKKLINLEMETSALLGLGKVLGHRCSSLCMVLANRQRKTFIQDFSSQMKNLLQASLDFLSEV